MKWLGLAPIRPARRWFGRHGELARKGAPKGSGGQNGIVRGSCKSSAVHSVS